jgi:hypothetical protein
MPSSPAKQLSSANRAFLEAAGARAERAGVFGSVRIVEAGEAPAGGRLVCQAKAAGAPAEYRIDFDPGEGGGRIWVSLVTADRWLSESIEAHLMHTGDKVEELLDEELVDLGFEGGPLPIHHFRSDDKLYTFRSPLALTFNGGEVVDATSGAEAAAKVLLAYEACFRQLGDMETTGEE